MLTKDFMGRGLVFGFAGILIIFSSERCRLTPTYGKQLALKEEECAEKALHALTDRNLVVKM